MTNEQLSARLKDIIIEQLGVKPELVTPSARFVHDLGCDSLDEVQLTMAIEDEFGIEIPDEDTPISTVGDMEKYLTAKLAA